MSQIAIDVRMWSHPGIGRYIRELVRQLVLLPGEETYELIGRLEDLSEFAFKDRLKTAKSNAPIYSLQEQVSLPWRVRSSGLLHVPHFNVPVAAKRPWVVTLHDLLYLQDPKASRSRWGALYVRTLMKHIQRNAAAIIAVSEFTKNDLLGRFPAIKSDKVFVTREAASPMFRRLGSLEGLASVKKKFVLNRPFVFFIGTLKPHKNLPVLIKAMKNLRVSRGVGHDLIVAGRKDPRHPEITAQILEENSWVKSLGEVSDEELLSLYHLADVMVFPSLWEGFGLPVLEAMSCGCPVISSNATSLPEIVGEAGLLFDPRRVDALEERLYNVLQDKELRQKMAQMGQERAKLFSWKKTAEETLHIYRRILS